LSEKLNNRKAAEDVAMRFTRGQGGWRLRPDRTRPADTTFSHEGRDVLVLDDEVAKAMADKTLDVKDTKAGPRLTLR
jgi:hypothetical protein